VEHWRAVFPTVGLTADQCDQITTSPARGPLLTALERGRALGHPMYEVLAGLIAARPLDGTRPAAETAAVLHHRVHEWLRAHTEDPAEVAITPDANEISMDIGALLDQVDDLLTERADTLGSAAFGSRRDVDPTHQGHVPASRPTTVAPVHGAASERSVTL
jgi:hypothetical protein